MFVDKDWIYKPPSIALQRIILIAFFTFAGALAWWQHSSQNDNDLVRKFTAAPLPEDVVDIDFSAAEAAWSELEVNDQGMLEINAQTELALSEVITLMNQEAFDSQVDRMVFLVEKQLGASVSQQFAELLPALKNYKDVEQRWWEENGNTVPPAYAELFQLQDEILGEALAEKLFAEQRRLANVMLASYHIQQDAGLTQAQKDQALADLQSKIHGGGVDE